MVTLNPATPCFLALEPDEKFAAIVRNFKRQTERRIGPQLFLDDPPHLTLYLACFTHVRELREKTREVAQGLRAPMAQVNGWYVFRDDPLTGNHTLVCDIAPEQRHGLALWQQHVCAAVASLRDPDSTLARYAPSWDRLPALVQENVTQWGFPFVGAIWRPHVTIASIRPADWDAIWADLQNDPPGGIVRFSELCLFALEQGRPVLLESFDLEPEL